MKLRTALRYFLLVCGIFLAACDSPGGVRLHDAAHPPQRLSDWGILIKEPSALRLAEASFVYQLNTPLFSDYAHKLRTLWMPEGTQASYVGDQVFEFPVGTIISKTFYYPIVDGYPAVRAEQILDADLRQLDTREVLLIETRLLVRSEAGWVAVPYVWNEAQDEAFLDITGDLRNYSVRSPQGQMLQANYLIPSRNQCANCHARRESGGIHPIGPKAWNLPVAQWLERGRLRAGQPILRHAAASQVRRYLDVNCAHCHSEEGAGDTSGLFLGITQTQSARLGVCKPPIAAGQGTGGYRYSIAPGSPGQSILLYRMRTTKPAEMMPELGRSLVHQAGVELVEAWIEGLQGHCG